MRALVGFIIAVVIPIEMTITSRFGRRKIRALCTDASFDNSADMDDRELRIPKADLGNGLERNDHLVSGDFRSRFEHISRYLVAGKGEWSEVVDIGCGTGYGVSLLSCKGVVIGIDVSPAAVKYARTKYPQCDYVIGDARATPLRSECVGAVTAYEVIEHMSDPEELLRECHRILVKGGLLYLSSPNPAHLANIVRRVFFGIPVPSKVDMGNIYHIREYTYKDMLSVISSNDYELVQSAGQTLPVDHILPRMRCGVRTVLHSIGLLEAYDWVLSVIGNRFPSLSWTVIYVLRRK